MIQRFTTGPGHERLNEIIDAVNALLAITGDGLVCVERTAGGAVMRLNVEALAARLAKPPPGQLWGKVLSSYPAASNRWDYTIALCDPDGTVHAAGPFDAYNAMEVNASDGGNQPTGLNASNLVTDDYTFAMQPIGTGAIVPVWPDRAADGTYWFAIPNQPDGNCGSGAS